MIGKLFEIVGNTIIPKPDCYIIEPIKKVIEEYPKEHLKIIAFLHYMKSLKPDDNPYADVPLDLREEKILQELKLDIDTQSDIIRDALQCVEEMYYTTFYGLYKGVKAIMDDIGRKLLTTSIDFTAKEGNAGNILKLMEKYEGIRKSFKVAYKDFEEEQTGSRARGGAELSEDEDYDY